MKTLVACLLALALAAPALAAEEKIPLFKNFTYGMTKAEVQKEAKAVPCEDPRLEGELCLPGTAKFGNQDWEQVFMFEGDKLAAVGLAREYSDKSAVNALQTIMGNKYSILMLANGAKQLDVIDMVVKGKAASLDAAIAAFERESANAEALTYSLFADKQIKELLQGGKSKNITEFMQNAPRDLRSVEIIRAGDNGLLIKFLAPKAALQDMLGKKDEVQDSF